MIYLLVFINSSDSTCQYVAATVANTLKTLEVIPTIIKLLAPEGKSIVALHF